MANARDAHFIRKTAVIGAPDPKRMSTSGVERYHCTARSINGRKRRLCLAFSKTLRGLRAAVALSVCAYNLTRLRLHASLRVTPAMAACVVSTVWFVRDLIETALSEPVGAAPQPQRLTLPAETGGPCVDGALRIIGQVQLMTDA